MFLLPNWSICIYLLCLHEIFYSALMTESRERLTHLEGALHRLEKETSELRLKRNILRQEEITEEIELIMLSAEQLKSQ